MTQITELQVLPFDTISKSKKCEKLATSFIQGEGDYPLNEAAIKNSLERMIGIDHSVQLLIKKNQKVFIKISAGDELLEGQGMMQLLIANVITMLCKEYQVRIFKIENEFIPEYA